MSKRQYVVTNKNKTLNTFVINFLAKLTGTPPILGRIVDDAAGISFDSKNWAYSDSLKYYEDRPNEFERVSIEDMIRLEGQRVLIKEGLYKFIVDKKTGAINHKGYETTLEELTKIYNWVSTPITLSGFSCKVTGNIEIGCTTLSLESFVRVYNQIRTVL